MFHECDLQSVLLLYILGNCKDYISFHVDSWPIHDYVGNMFKNQNYTYNRMRQEL